MASGGDVASGGELTKALAGVELTGDNNEGETVAVGEVAAGVGAVAGLGGADAKVGAVASLGGADAGVGAGLGMATGEGETLPGFEFESFKLSGINGAEVHTAPIPQDYDVSVTFSRNAFLVDLVNTVVGRVLKLDSIENGDAWRGYDMLIFNTWHWWLHKGSKQPWDYIEAGGEILKDMDRLVAFREGLTTWSKWVDSNVDFSNTKVFFQGISPTHYNGKEWNESDSATCNGQTQPVGGSIYQGGSPPAATVVNQVLTAMASPVIMLDITLLSQLRKDGHPSAYGFDGKKGNDCSHWCLAGVPDTWNELFNATLVATDH